MQALALFREPPNPGGDLIWAQRNYWESTHSGKDRQVGTRAYGARRGIHAPNGDQILGPGGLCGGMDLDRATTPTGHSITLEHVLQWLLHPQWYRGRCSVDLPLG
jgi:hypothetical protein